MIDGDLFRLDGRQAIITGAARGLGRSMALGLAAFGADVHLCDRLAEGLAETAEDGGSRGGRVGTAVLDVRDAQLVDDWVGCARTRRRARQQRGRHVPRSVPRRERQRAEGARRLQLHQRHQLRAAPVCRRCRPVRRSSTSPRSRLSRLAGIRHLRCDEGRRRAPQPHPRRSSSAIRGIRVNTIAPDGLPTAGEDDLRVGDDDYDYSRKLALGWGSTDDICGAAVFLASSASRYVTGTTIHVDGGSNAGRGWMRDAAGNWVP